MGVASAFGPAAAEDQAWFVLQAAVSDVCSLEITRNVYCGMNYNDTEFGVE